MARLCRARLVLPSADGTANVIFECNQPKHPTENEAHVENGRVRGQDGRTRRYVVTWRDDVESEVWRQPAKPTFIVHGEDVPQTQAIESEADADD